ncbi:MAG: VOC family protein [Pirellulaceae bacterium]|nr:glyoxalase [Planctomycetaceae bacterium]
MRFLQLDHVALHVCDVEQSSEFYANVLKLESIPRPPFSFHGAWFRLGERQELHLIGDRDQVVNSKHRGTHFALLVDDIDLWESHFSELGIEHAPRRIRPDNAYQINVTDPDGYCIELCTPPGTAQIED